MSPRIHTTPFTPFRHRASAFLAGVGLLLGLVGGQVQAQSPTPVKPIVIAQVSPTEGYLGFYTRQLQLGANAAFQAVNARGGIAGQPVRFVTVDDGADPKRSIEAYETVAAKASPVAFLYHVGPDSIVRLLESRTLDKLKIPLLGTIPAIDAFRTPVRPYVFHLRRGEEAEIAAIARQLMTIGLSRLSVLYLDDPAGRGAVPIVEREIKAVGGSLVHSAAVALGQNVSDAAIAEIAARRTQVVLLFMAAETAGQVVSKLRKAGNELPLYSVSYLDARTLVASAGARYARGVAISQSVPNPMKSVLPLAVEFRRDMAALTPPPPPEAYTPFTFEGYIAARVLVEAVRASGKSAPSGRDVQAALENLNVDLGGLPVRFRADTHVGLHFIDIGMVRENGELLY
ncbi:MAG: ABC transporter substrate-binding protein [Azonexus sp.]|jgi:ABC-type branched-subunit amino acid transport system substrate-binding protein|nr:ABC transporter substrate-binding protein [Azonexus sp.]